MELTIISHKMITSGSQENNPNCNFVACPALFCGKICNKRIYTILGEAKHSQ